MLNDRGAGGRLARARQPRFDGFSVPTFHLFHSRRHVTCPRRRVTSQSRARDVRDTVVVAWWQHGRRSQSCRSC